ncbi:MAG: sigma-70 family RNA polymerase sigma factor [Gemmatimonadota bacterium]|nr:sigma-70 family RNA polymerase sigma factor [Gemmatimonadota bacterium]
MDVEHLYREHSPALFRYLFRFSGDPEVAADAVQEAFLRLVERKPRDDQVRGWLFRVATNLVMERGRTQRRRLRLLEENPGRVPYADLPGDPDEELERKERQREVQRALATLPERDRMVLLMRAEGFTQREIAEAVGVNPKGMGSILGRAQAKLAAALRINVEVVP